MFPDTLTIEVFLPRNGLTRLDVEFQRGTENLEVHDVYPSDPLPNGSWDLCPEDDAVARRTADELAHDIDTHKTDPDVAKAINAVTMAEVKLLAALASYDLPLACRAEARLWAEDLASRGRAMDMHERLHESEIAEIAHRYTLRARELESERRAAVLPEF